MGFEIGKKLRKSDCRGRGPADNPLVNVSAAPWPTLHRPGPCHPDEAVITVAAAGLAELCGRLGDEVDQAAW
jgi:hypothetical protein